jgi:hypothetical protein
VPINLWSKTSALFAGIEEPKRKEKSVWPLDVSRADHPVALYVVSAAEVAIGGRDASIEFRVRREADISEWSTSAVAGITTDTVHAMFSK